MNFKIRYLFVAMLTIVVGCFSISASISAMAQTNTSALQKNTKNSSAQHKVQSNTTITASIKPVIIRKNIGNSPLEIAAATQAYLDKMPPSATKKSNNYFTGGYWLTLWNYLLSLVIAWWLLSYKISVRMRDLAQRWTKIKSVHTVIYVLLYSLLTSIISLPFNIYQSYFREHSYGLSNLTLSGWFGEQLKGLMINMIMLSMLLVIVYAVIRKFRQTWALWGAVVGVVFLAFILLIGPVFISPLFNDYTPLNNSPLKSQILSMARANGVPANNVYEYNASKQSKRISANVSGLMGTTRISLNDNLLNLSSDATVKAVMGHEMGHYVLNHGPKMLVEFGLVLGFGFMFVKWGFKRFNKISWGIKDETDIAGLPLFIILLSTWFFIMTPVTNSIVRTSETEADIFGLNVSAEPEGFAEGILSLSNYRKMKASYWEEVFFYDHPTGYNRIYAAMRWRSEHPIATKNHHK